jgi:hypothetical protein
MDVSNLMESDFLSVDFVKNSLSKRATILSGGTEDTYKDSRSLKVLIEVDAKQKFWRINKISLRSLADKYGKDSSLWVGKQVAFSVVVTMLGKESIIATPL